MKIATWNINSVKARLPHLVEWLQSSAPDVVLLQETKCLEEAFPFEPLEDLGYNISVYGQKTYNGVAILSKYPLEDVTKGMPSFSEDPQARYIEAVTNQVRVASVYVPNGQEVGSEKFAYKMAFYEALFKHSQTLLTLDEAIVLGGDYNVAPFPEDMHNPTLSGTDRILCSVQEQNQLRRLFNSGYQDGLRLTHPIHLEKSHSLFTWWDYRAGSFDQNKGYRIDHLLLSPQAADRTLDADVDTTPRGWQRPSDHTPVLVKLS
tara:strand:- start:1975 stop:2760 length:786 start_codon:yes stop_codon:yes gene_type:complete